jgi:hypothetical protein
MTEKAELLNAERFKNLERELSFVGVVASESLVDDRGTLGSGGFTPREDVFNYDYNIGVLCEEAANQGGQYVVEVSRDEYLKRAEELEIKQDLWCSNNPNRVFGFVYKSR